MYGGVCSERHRHAALHQHSVCYTNITFDSCSTAWLCVIPQLTHFTYNVQLEHKDCFLSGVSLHSAAIYAGYLDPLTET